MPDSDLLKSPAVPARSAFGCLVGALAADALAMPVHWYYDRAALRRDYGQIDRYRAPQEPHPDSILWRSSYTPASTAFDLLGEEAAQWGRKGVHYHRRLPPGWNTLNAQLAIELYRHVRESEGRHVPDLWLKRYVAFLRSPERHRDTYVEECHRGFFANLARGRKPGNCAVIDRHIGGLAQVPALVAAVADATGRLPGPEEAAAVARQHVALTHRHRGVQDAADAFARILVGVLTTGDVRGAIESASNGWFSRRSAQQWRGESDLVVVGRHLSPACYIEDAFPAALHLAWRHHECFGEGIRSNAEAGGDNCHRGIVVGSLLAAGNGVPARWLGGLGCLHRLEPASAPATPVG